MIYCLEPNKMGEVIKVIEESLKTSCVCVSLLYKCMIYILFFGFKFLFDFLSNCLLFLFYFNLSFLIF
ncbi:hypothetical protein Hanom_Chr07g00640021 [Helianthus anomalus]